MLYMNEFEIRTVDGEEVLCRKEFVDKNIYKLVPIISKSEFLLAFNEWVKKD